MGQGCSGIRNPGPDTNINKECVMPWPKTLASRIVSGYFALKYDLVASDLRRHNPPMGSMPFFNNSASPAIRRGELQLVAGKLLKFLKEMGIPLEKGSSDSAAHGALVSAMEVEDAPSSGMVVAIDEHYRFKDEADD